MKIFNISAFKHRKLSISYIFGHRFSLKFVLILQYFESIRKRDKSNDLFEKVFRTGIDFILIFSMFDEINAWNYQFMENCEGRVYTEAAFHSYSNGEPRRTMEDIKGIFSSESFIVISTRPDQFWDNLSLNGYWIERFLHFSLLIPSKL